MKSLIFAPLVICAFALQGCYSKHVEKTTEPRDVVIHEQQPDVVIHEHDHDPLYRKETIIER